MVMVVRKNPNGARGRNLKRNQNQNTRPHLGDTRASISIVKKGCYKIRVYCNIVLT